MAKTGKLAMCPSFSHFVMLKAGPVNARVPRAQCAGGSLHSKPQSQPGRPTQPSAMRRAPSAPESERSRVPCDVRLMQPALCAVPVGRMCL